MDGERKGESSSSFKMGNTAQETGLLYVPDCYVVPPSCRSSASSPETGTVPVIDISKMSGNQEERFQVVREIGDACKRIGFFQIVNHGISQTVLDGALLTAFDFFNCPAEEKRKFMSNDVYKPVRYGTSLKDGVDKIQFWRVFLKHYAHPLDRWIHLWPQNPHDYREKMGKFGQEVRKVAVELMGAVTESLGLGPDYVSPKMEKNGMQVMAVNCYPPCPEPEVALGLPPHSDYSCLTVLLQSSPGLEILVPDADGDGGRWIVVPEIKGALQVHVGDHVEVLSNGKYRSVIHKATLNGEKTRVSIASLHSLGEDDKMRVPKELVIREDGENRSVRYKESSFNDFLGFLAKNDIADGKRFIDTLKITNLLFG